VDTIGNMAVYAPGTSPLIRLTPLSLADIPSHPDLPLSESKLVKVKDDIAQPDLLPFITTCLRDGLAFLSKSQIEKEFKKNSTKKAEGSLADVDILTRSFSKSFLTQNVPWSPTLPTSEPTGPPSRRASKATTNSTTDNTAQLTVPPPTTRGRSSSSASARQGPISRARPTTLQDEHWFTRRSIHQCISSKLTPGTASWEQFVFGLLKNHSANEQEFTPNLFDARKVVDWDGQVRKLTEEGSLRREGWDDVSIGIMEMCHGLPGSLAPRCFPVLVVGGRLLPQHQQQQQNGGSSAAAGAGFEPDPRWESGEKQKFVVVTVPVQLGTAVKKAFYSNFRNLKEGKTEQEKANVVFGLYAAVETCTLRDRVGGEEEEVEWIMSTASDASGNLPMWMQKMSMPGMLPKDVSYFMKWIKDVDEERVEEVVANTA
jgi:hypothetical protein